MKEAPLIEARRVSFSFRKTSVLREVSFRAEAGEAVALAGQNGAGKTTLFRIILGLLPDYGGEVFIGGKDGRRMAARERARRIAYIPQQAQQVFNYPVLLVVMMGRNAHISSLRGPRAEDEDAAYKALDTLGIARLAGRGFAEISGGERQLVLIARALAGSADIFVMDEPAANLDYGNQIRVMNRVRALAAEGFLVLFSTHNPEHALRFADKVIFLHNGAIEACGAPREVLNSALLEKVYEVRAAIQEVSVEGRRVSVCVPLM